MPRWLGALFPVILTLYSSSGMSEDIKPCFFSSKDRRFGFGIQQQQEHRRESRNRTNERRTSDAGYLHTENPKPALKNVLRQAAIKDAEPARGHPRQDLGERQWKQIRGFSISEQDRSMNEEELKVISNFLPAGDSIWRPETPRRVFISWRRWNG